MVVSLPAAPAPALAEPRDDAGGSERNEIAADAESLTAEPLAAPPSAPGVESDAAYPRQNDLPVPPEDPDDHSVKLGPAPFHDIAPTLNDLQETSDRVSAEIIGESVQGCDLYLVTLTEPLFRNHPQGPVRAGRPGPALVCRHRWRRLILDTNGCAPGR